MTRLVGSEMCIRDRNKVAEALAIEKELAYMVESGRYWESEIDFDKDKLKAIDSVWLSAKKSAS
jgi:hypothetical protein